MWRRFIHTTRNVFNAQKSPLAALRSKTGYSIANCKKALELHQNDLSKAEEWLHEQAKADGWGKVNLQSRPTRQGLIGIATMKNFAAMVEVNCETDFVARNAKFQDLVATVSESALDYYADTHNIENGLSKIEISKDDLQRMKCKQSSMGSLADYIASGITLTGEQLSLKRGICYHFHPKSAMLSAYCHPPGVVRNTMLGKYGCFLVHRQINPTENVDIRNEDIAKELCLQVIGTNPKVVGNRLQIIKEEEEREKQLERKKNEEPQQIQEQQQQQQVQENQEETGAEVESSDEEIKTRASHFTATERDKRNQVLLLQEYMHDPDYYVWEYLEDYGMEVVDFVRFQCGESLE